MARRSPGEGSVYRRKSDGKIVVQMTLPDGSRKAFYTKDGKTAFKTKAEGKDFLREELDKLKQGLPLGPGEELGVYLPKWLENVARPRIDPRTCRDYEQIVRLHLLPKLATCPINRLAPPHIAELYSEKLKTLSPRRVQYIHAVLHSALEQAVKWNLIGRNPADAVEAPRPQRREPRILSPDQVKVLFHAVRDDRLEALYILAITTTMRQGELLGLRWESLDLAGGMLYVVRNLQRLNGEWRLKDPKTKRSRRGIRLASIAVGALQRHHRRQSEERELAGDDWTETGLVFTTELGRPIDGKSLTVRKFYPALERAGLPPMHFHDLRHTAASLYMALGVPPKVVQEMLGHSTVLMTLDTYSHLLPNLQENAVAKMDRLLGSGPRED